MFTSALSQQDANDQALTYAQNAANTNGQCSQGINLQYQHYSWGNVSVQLINNVTFEQYFFDINSSGSGFLGSVPLGNYNITIIAQSAQAIYFSCGSFYPGSTAYFPDVDISEFCNLLEVY
jgi:hypothetical protein